jgi:uncharacterized protein (DUF1800 family)/uncharacterized protein (DUF1501 family)
MQRFGLLCLCEWMVGAGIASETCSTLPEEVSLLQEKLVARNGATKADIRDAKQIRGLMGFEAQLTVHLEPEASNACSTSTVGEAECREAVVALLPAGQDQGRLGLMIGKWRHVPVGCSAQSGGDWAAYFNRRSVASNSGDYSPVCTGPEPLHQLVAHLEPEASNACSTESVSEADCLEAVRSLLPEGQAQGRTGLAAGSWGQKPFGCSVQSGGDWAAHFNRNRVGRNSGDYSPVCTGSEPVDQLVAHLEPEASNACSTESVSEADCLEAVRSLLPAGQSQRRKGLVVGSWHRHVPVGCAVQSGGDWTAHFNRASVGSNSGSYSPVCTGREPLHQLVAHLEPQASNACSTESVSEAECLEAVRSLLPEGQAQGRTGLAAGSWGHVPAGCSVQSGGDWAAYFNHNTAGRNSGDYSPVCTGLEALHQLIAHLEPRGRIACSTDSVSEAECLEAVRLLLPEGQAQGRTGLAVGSWGHVPFGCSVQSGGDWAAHFNRQNGGSNSGDFSPVCIEAEPNHQVIAHLESRSSDVCSTASTSEAACLQAVQKLLPGGLKQGRKHLVSGSWEHAPAGCSVQSGGDWAAHFNHKTGSNNGGYSPVCRGYNPATPEVVVPSFSGSDGNRASDARFLIQATFGPTRKALDSLAASTYPQWIQEQMSLEPGLHRTYYRLRANPKPTDPSERVVASPRARCAQGSRWSGLAFTRGDEGHSISVRDNRVDVNGVFRTEVAPILELGSWPDFEFDGYICWVDESIGQIVSLRPADGRCGQRNNRVDMQNFAIWLSNLDSLDHSLTFTELRPEVLLLASDLDDCPDNDFVRVGERVYRHDPRIELLENSLEHPAHACLSVPKSLFNVETCVFVQGCPQPACGSPGEVANDPSKGHQFLFFAMFPHSDREYDNPYEPRVNHHTTPKSATWTMKALYGNDQLRQRVSWALSQIYVTGTPGFGGDTFNEEWVNYYDIFVRNAFGNLQDLLREVTYSPLMGDYLTYAGSTSWDHNRRFPDENYAREIMELFTIGKFLLHEGGAPVLDDNGQQIQAYNNDNVMDLARVFTGFKRQSFRANIERNHRQNHIDPMRINAHHHDVYPKMDLNGNHLGDGYPLCSDRASGSFLALGARFEFLGTAYAGQDVFVLDEASELFAALCGQIAPPCAFSSTVVLDAAKACFGAECQLELPNVVQASEGFYEFVPSPCVHLYFFQGREIAPTWHGHPYHRRQCRRPSEAAAAVSCCAGCTDVVTGWMVSGGRNLTCAQAFDQHSTFWRDRCAGSHWDGHGICRKSCWDYGVGYEGDNCSIGEFQSSFASAFPGELKTLAAGESACASMGLGICPYRVCPYDEVDGASCSDRGPRQFAWTTDMCAPEVEVDAFGKVSSHMTELAAQNRVFVQWSEGSFPNPDDCHSSGCYRGSDANTCLCSIQVQESPVFNRLPSIDEFEHGLAVGAFAPVGARTGSIGNEVQAHRSGDAFDANTVFEYAGRFKRNVQIMVRVGDNGTHSFRNPPVFSVAGIPNVRAVMAEVEALLDHLMSHSNLPTFISFRLIQRLVTSNPSPDYVRVVAGAFRTRSYGGVAYPGDLAAAVAAVLLHPEARNQSADRVGAGGLREPLVKVIHFMRAMDYEDDRNPQIALQPLDDVIGQFPYHSPSVFNFYLPNFEPARFPAGLVAPEFQILQPPLLVSTINGMLALINNGVSACEGGFGFGLPSGCHAPSGPPLNYRDAASRRGSVTFSLPDSATSEQVIGELDLLLTGGRLNGSMAAVRHAYENAAQDDRLRAAQRTIILTPEFNTLGDSPSHGIRAPTEHSAAVPARSYKAVVMLWLSGGLDSFNLLVPCPGEEIGIFQEYKERRTDAGMNASDLLKISTEGQTCATFGVHHKLPFLKDLYDQGHAAFVSNIGSLVKPLTGAQFRSGGERCHGLFSHSDQYIAAQTLQCQVAGSGPRGSGGRMADALLRGNMTFKTESFSVAQKNLWSQGFHVPSTAISRRHGVVRFQHGDELMETISNISSRQHVNVYCEEYAKVLAEAVDATEHLGSHFDNAVLHADFSQSTLPLALQLAQVSRLISARENRSAERDFFQVEFGSFDTHSEVHEHLAIKFEQINEALELFVQEMRNQNAFEDVVLVVQSDFGRALHSNGFGTDHGWAGNTFLLGGSVNGGRVYNDFLESYLEGSEQDIGHGRLVPRYPWESMMVPVAQWMGIEQHQLEEAFPNIGNFPDSHFIPRDVLFIN